MTEPPAGRVCLPEGQLVRSGESYGRDTLQFILMTWDAMSNGVRRPGAKVRGEQTKAMVSRKRPALKAASRRDV